MQTTDGENAEVSVETASSGEAVRSHRPRTPSERSHGGSTVRSRKSVGSKKAGSVVSNVSSTQSLYVSRLAKFESAKVRQRYIDKEIELIKKKTELETDLLKLKSECDFNIAESELKVIESHLDEENIDPDDDTEVEINTQARVRDFVNETDPLSADKPPFIAENTNASNAGVPSSPYAPYNFYTTNTPPVVNPNMTQAVNTNTAPVEPPDATTCDVSPSIVPNIQTNHQANNVTQQSAEMVMCEQMSKFLTKKEMLRTRLYNFDDNPAYFEAWQSTFKSVVSELSLTPSEELELLRTKLGPESTKYARSIYAANKNPTVACYKLWERLQDRYGSPEVLQATLKSKLSMFPKLTNKEPKKLIELADLISEIEAVKSSPRHAVQFSYFDSSCGVVPIIQKLPHGIQDKWTNTATKYKTANNAAHPPFSVFVKFIMDIAKMKNDPSFVYDEPAISKSFEPRGNLRSTVRANKVDAIPDKHSTSDSQFSGMTENSQVCPLHGTNHSLNMCRAFRHKPFEERMDFLRNNGLCFKCCGPNKHMAKKCQRRVTCGICKSTKHPAALHVDTTRPSENPSVSNQQDHKASSECNSDSQAKTTIMSSCLSVCGNTDNMSKSCAKTVLVRVHSEENPNDTLDLYAVIDEQSNKTLAKPELFDFFGIQGPGISYSLTSCSGTFQQSGRQAHGLVVSSYDGSCSLRLPNVIECEHLPDDRSEIPTPKTARAYAHLREISGKIPPLNDRADILLLIGRDLLRAHHVLDQRLGHEETPYAQQLPLGWVIVGEACFGASHDQDSVSAFKTYTLANGRQSYIQPCENELSVKETDIFVKTPLDNFPSLSVDDRRFISQMESGISKGDDGCWSLPLPFRENRTRLPNNKLQAVKRANLLTTSLRRNPAKRDHVIDFMGKLFTKQHAEFAPVLNEEEEQWFLPLFAVYHPKKPGNVRCVFDSSAKCGGISLNDVLLTGPDLLNSLLGILMRFRCHSIAISADIEQMFYRFSVPPEHRNFLKFMWHKENDINQELVEYRMKRHVFGNSPSPAVANFGLCKSVEEADPDVKQFVEENFYVDDGLTSVDSSEEAISLLQRTKTTLNQNANIRLHKIVSNDVSVLNAFPIEDLAKDITTYNLELSETPPQRTLGVSWNVATDTFVFQVSKTVHPFTKRGVLATVNSLYDPLGFLAPVGIRGKLIMRDIMSAGLDWDDPLPTMYHSKWSEWRESLPHLENVTVPRTYADVPSMSIKLRELHVFSDASQSAIAAVAYMRIFDINGQQHISFVHGKAKVAPQHGHTIPRLELCAAVLATQLKDTVIHHLKWEFDTITMYTDSKIVLGYLNNTKRRFYVYVDNRVSQIRQSTTVDQWCHIPSAENPADLATRSVPAKEIAYSMWLRGPSFDIKTETPNVLPEPFELVNPDRDVEIRPTETVKSACTNVKLHHSGLVDRFKNFSMWSKLVRAIANLQHVAKSYKRQEHCKGWHFCSLSTDDLRHAEKRIILDQQYESFKMEMDCLREGKPLPHSSSILCLSPFLDKDGVLCVGGRLGQARQNLSLITVNPVIIPKKSHIATLLIRYYHAQVNHQGRRITEGRLRSVGYWIIGMKRLVASVIHSCVMCRKLRGHLCTPRMADLPVDRLTPGPPFTFVGLDTFGPWNVISRKTRGGVAQHKRWAILFTCLVSRAIHIEVVEELSASSFINALRRFLAIRGPVRQFRSDRGTNFVGAVNELGIPAKFTEEESVKQFLNQNSCSWTFNPPHASHFGGSWERMIGVSRKILDAMLLRTNQKDLTHETLTTFLAEVTAIVNSRPLTNLSEDPSDLVVLTPSMLLTHKSGELPECIPSLGPKDMYKAQWRHVQLLADEFWKRWQRDYLSTLQGRVKWTNDVQNVKEGDLVLIRDTNYPRNKWPLAVVTRAFPSDDNRVRKVELRMFKDNKCTLSVRPVHELITLLV